MVNLDHRKPPSKNVIERLTQFYFEKYRGGEEDLENALRSLALSCGAGEKGYFQLTPGGGEATFQMFLNFYLEEVRETGRNYFMMPVTEESAVHRMEDFGCCVKLLPVDKRGILTPHIVAAAIKPKTSLLSLSWANGLTGVLQPLEEIISCCKVEGVKVHVNASAVIGKMPISFQELGVDFLSFDIPPGMGGLFQLNPIKNPSLQVAAVSALSLALEEELQQTALEIVRLRDAFEAELKYMLPDSQILFQEEDRLPHVSAMAFPGVMAEALLFMLDRQRVYATLGGGSYQKLSTQLQHCGISDEIRHSAISFVLSHKTTEADLAYAVDVIVSSVRQLSALSHAL